MRLDWIRPNHDCIIQLGMRIFWECVRCAESPFVLETGSRAERDGGPWGDSDTRAEAESDLSRHCGAKDTPLQTILTRITTHTRRTTKYLLFESNSTITNNLNKIHFWTTYLQLERHKLSQRLIQTQRYDTDGIARSKAVDGWGSGSHHPGSNCHRQVHAEIYRRWQHHSLVSNKRKLVVLSKLVKLKLAGLKLVVLNLTGLKVAGLKLGGLKLVRLKFVKLKLVELKLVVLRLTVNFIWVYLNFVLITSRN